MTPNEEVMEVPPPVLEEVLEGNNLEAAWLAVKANGGACGPDGRDIEATIVHIREHYRSIVTKLSSGQYKPGAIRSVSIPKASGGHRSLGIPNVQDRWIQQAIHQKLSRRCEGYFSAHSFGFRPNRSAHDAVAAAREMIKSGKSYVVDIDLKSFFDEVNHDKLMYLLMRHVQDKKLRKLIGSFLKAPVRKEDGKCYKRDKGTPQGGPLSPLLANIYLDPLDKELESRGLSFVRYADDIAIFVSSQRAADRILESITGWIEKNLKVPVNRDKSRSGPTDDSSLLGFRLHADGAVSVAPKSVERMKQRVRQLWDAKQSLTSQQLRDQWRRYITGWCNYFGFANRNWTVRRWTGWVRRHMRKCFWLRWSTPAGRINAMKRLGLPKRYYGIGYTGLGAWRIAKSPMMSQALSTRRLEKCGFILPWPFVEATRKPG